jgi:hypothetical protein
MENPKMAYEKSPILSEEGNMPYSLQACHPYTEAELNTHPPIARIGASIHMNMNVVFVSD